jgi:NTE family protein
MKALVLSGGGAKGSYQIGALKYLLGERGENYDIITGTSVGALNGAFLSMFSSGNELDAIKGLEKLWLGIDSPKIWKKWYWGLLGILPVVLPWWLGGRTSAYSTAPLRNLVDKYLNPKAVASSGKILRIGAVDLDSGVRQVWDEKDLAHIKKAVLASSSFPLFFEPVEIAGRLYTDAGVREICPIEDAIRAGADEIHLIATGPVEVTTNLDRKGSGITFGQRIIDIMSSEVEYWDVKAVELYNALYKAKHPLAVGKSLVKMKVLCPKQVILDNSLDFSPEKITTNISLGYTDAKAMNWETVSSDTDLPS